MSNSVAMVTVERVVAKVRRHVEVDNNLAQKVAKRKNVSVDAAKSLLLSSAANKALKFTGGDEKKAGMALIITNGRVNRLPQCAKLLKKFRSNVVRTAYEIKDDLTISDASLRALCDLVEHTDGDLEGESSRIQVVLDEIASRAISKQQQFFYNRRLREEVKLGRLIEAVGNEILDEIDRREECDSIESETRSEIYEKEYSK